MSDAMTTPLTDAEIETLADHAKKRWLTGEECVRAFATINHLKSLLTETRTKALEEAAAVCKSATIQFSVALVDQPVRAAREAIATTRTALAERIRAKAEGGEI